MLTSTHHNIGKYAEKIVAQQIKDISSSYHMILLSNRLDMTRPCGQAGLLAIDHHTFKQQRIAHDCIEGGLVLPIRSWVFTWV